MVARQMILVLRKHSNRRSTFFPLRSTESQLLLLARQEIPEHGRQLFGETACFGDRFELPVDILRVTLLSSTDTAYDDYVVLRINSVNDAVVAELVLPIARRSEERRVGKESRSRRW